MGRQSRGGSQQTKPRGVSGLKQSFVQSQIYCQSGHGGGV